MAFRWTATGPNVSMGQKVAEDPRGASRELSATMKRYGSNMGLVADHYGVHRATVERWFDRLAAAGHPVKGRGEAKMGCRAREGLPVVKKAGAPAAQWAQDLCKPKGRVRRAAAS